MSNDYTPTLVEYLDGLVDKCDAIRLKNQKDEFRNYRFFISAVKASFEDMKNIITKKDFSSLETKIMSYNPRKSITVEEKATDDNSFYESIEMIRDYIVFSIKQNIALSVSGMHDYVLKHPQISGHLDSLVGNLYQLDQ